MVAVELFRPVGLGELRHIAALDFASFPPRLPEQPIFYPVLDREYAEQIARDWNTKDAASGYVGVVLRFTVSDQVAARYPVHRVGADRHRELQIPAAELESFNAGIEGRLEVVSHYVGREVEGALDPTTGLPIELADLQSDRFVVWRQDDNGNRVRMREGLSLSEAETVVREFEARGHKQMYWVQADPR